MGIMSPVPSLTQKTRRLSMALPRRLMPACFRVEMVRGLPNESGDLKLEAVRELLGQEVKGKWEEISMHECNVCLWSKVGRVD